MKMNKGLYFVFGLFFFCSGLLGLRFVEGLSKLGWFGYLFLMVLGLVDLYSWATFDDKSKDEES